MLINAAPADEIAEIRGQIRMLKDREEALRQGFLTGEHLRRGHAYEVLVKPARQRKFLKDKLPRDILDDPAYWSEKTTQTVVVQAVDPSDEFDVFEPFD